MITSVRCSCACCTSREYSMERWIFVLTFPVVSSLGDGVLSSKLNLRRANMKSAAAEMWRNDDIRGDEISFIHAEDDSTPREIVEVIRHFEKLQCELEQSTNIGNLSPEVIQSSYQ